MPDSGRSSSNVITDNRSKNIYNADKRALDDEQMTNTKLTPYMQIQLYKKLLEQEVGYDKANELITKAELEYAAILNSSNIEIR